MEDNMIDTRLDTPLRVLHVAIGLTATLAGLDKFFNLLADWSHYVSPAVTPFLPVPVHTLMMVVGVVEFAVGVTTLAIAPRIGAYVASAWLLLIAVNLVIGGFFDIAVRDVVLSVAAFVVARSIEMRDASPVAEAHAVGRRPLTA
jgi:hypothetical protein